MRSTEPSPSGWSRLLRSFVYAGRGIVRLIAAQQNARVHLLALIAAIAMGAWLGLSSLEWCAIVIISALVLVAEALNSALEALADRTAPERHPLVEQAKDIAAAAVLLAAVASVIVGLLILGPKLLVKLGIPFD